jgi:hypothetical protein
MKIYYQFGLTFSLVVFLFLTVTSQTTFQKTFGSSFSEEAKWVANTSTGYIVAGFTTTANSDRDGYLLNLDFAGNVIWQKRIGRDADDVFNVVYETTGGFLVLGETLSYGAGGKDAWLLKISPAGTILWSKTLGDATTDELGLNMFPVSGDRILVSGVRAPEGTFSYHACFYLLDNTGQTIWSRTYSNDGLPNQILANYVDNGVIYASGGTNGNGGFLRVDLETGDVISGMEYAGNFNESLYYLQPSPDGNLMLCDATWSATNNVQQRQWLNKVTREGQSLWSKVYSRPGGGLRGKIEDAGDGNFLLSSYDGTFSDNGDALLTKIDEDGNIMWSRNYGQPGLDWLWKAQLTPDGGYVSVGVATTMTGDRDVLIVKTDYEGLVAGCCIPSAGIFAENHTHTNDAILFSREDWVSSVPFTTQQVNANLQESAFCGNEPVGIFNDIALCANEAFTFNGVDYYAPDLIIDVLPGLYGCDTTIYYGLLLLSNINLTDTISFCPGETVSLGGQTYSQPDTVSLNFNNPNGCDTIVTYYLVYDTDPANCTSCNGTFLKIVGDEGQNVHGHGVYEAGDGNLYITGTKQDSALLIKMRPSGSIIWSRTFDILPNTVDNIAEIIVDSEGMIVGCGQCGDVQPIEAGFAFRYDPVGNTMLWTRLISTGSPYVMGIMEKSPGGNYILNSNPHEPFNNAQLTEISRADGTLAPSPLNKMFDVGSADNFNSTMIFNGKIYGVGRFTAGNLFTDMRHTLTKIDLATGQLEFANLGHFFAGPPARLYGMDFVIRNNNIISVGFGDETGEDLNNSKIFFYVDDLQGGTAGQSIRIDLQSTTSDAVDEIVRVPDGYILLCRSSFNSPADIFLVKINLLGELIWSKKVDFGIDQLLPVSIVQSQILAKDGFLYCVATTTTNATGEKRMMILKISQDGKMDGQCDYIADTPATAELLLMTSGEGVTPVETPVTDTYEPRVVAVSNSTPASEFLCRELVEDQVDITLCAGESITLGGQDYSTPDTVVLTLLNNIGCDSIITYIIEVLPQLTRSESISFCPGETVVIGGQAYTQSGTVIDTLPGIAACDTIVTYTLTLLPQPTRSESISFCPGEIVMIGGQAYTQSGTVIDTLPGVVACDTIVTYTLTLLPQPTRSESISFCPGETVVIGGQAYTQPGTVVDTIPGVAACDTIVTYTLTSLLPSPSVVSIECPNDISLIAGPGMSPLVVNYNLPTAMSDCPCPGLALTQTAGLPSGAEFPNGITEVCYSAKDSCGQVASCCFTVTIREVQPCDVKVNGCMRYELLSITADPVNNLTYRIQVTNNCSNKMIYTVIQLPNSVVAKAPANLSVFTAPSGRQYDVRNPNYSPFYSLRFQSIADGISNGQSDIFEYTLPVPSAPTYIHIGTRLAPQEYYEAHLNTFYCPKGITMPNNRADFSESLKSEKLLLFPNPSDGTLWVDLSAWAGESVQWRIFNSQGQQLIANTSATDEGLLRLELPQGMPNGLFFFEILQEGGQRETTRFVLQR